MKQYLILFFFCPLVLLAQKHDYHWMLGYSNPMNNDTSGVFGGVVMDFNESPVRIYKKNNKLNFNDFCATCADSVGNIIYYSNGIRIYNKDDKLMVNGDTINPGAFSIWNNFKDNRVVVP